MYSPSRQSVKFRSGVGQLVQTAIAKGRSTRPEIKLGICGEHGGDPDSVKLPHLDGR